MAATPLTPTAPGGEAGCDSRRTASQRGENPPQPVDHRGHGKRARPFRACRSDDRSASRRNPRVRPHPPKQRPRQRPERQGQDRHPEVLRFPFRRCAVLHALPLLRRSECLAGFHDAVTHPLNGQESHQFPTGDQHCPPVGQARSPTRAPLRSSTTTADQRRRRGPLGGSFSFTPATPSAPPDPPAPTACGTCAHRTRRAGPGSGSGAGGSCAGRRGGRGSG
jgi:hypothetical protein